MSRKEGLRWLRTGRKQPRWRKTQWISHYLDLAIAIQWLPPESELVKLETNQYMPEDELMRFLKPRLSDNIGVFLGRRSGGLVVIDFNSPHAAEKAYAFFNGDLEEARKRFTFVRTPHGGIHVYIWTKWDGPDNVIGSPFRSRFNIFGNGIHIIGDGYVAAPPSVIDHADCFKGKHGCPGRGKGRYVLMNDLGVGEMPDFMPNVCGRAEELEWITPGTYAASGG